MAEHPYRGFKQVTGRGLCHVAEWRREWLAPVGWQKGLSGVNCSGRRARSFLEFA